MNIEIATHILTATKPARAVSVTATVSVMNCNTCLSRTCPSMTVINSNGR